jgi:hypothetical protein
VGEVEILFVIEFVSPETSGALVRQKDCNGTHDPKGHEDESRLPEGERPYERSEQKQ